MKKFYKNLALMALLAPSSFLPALAQSPDSPAGARSGVKETGSLSAQVWNRTIKGGDSLVRHAGPGVILFEDDNAAADRKGGDSIQRHAGPGVILFEDDNAAADRKGGDSIQRHAGPGVILFEDANLAVDRKGGDSIERHADPGVILFEDDNAAIDRKGGDSLYRTAGPADPGLNLWPVPASGGSLNVGFSTGMQEFVTIEVISAEGRIHAVQMVPSSASENSITVDISMLPAGNYGLRVSGSTQRLLKRFVVM